MLPTKIRASIIVLALSALSALWTAAACAEDARNEAPTVASPSFIITLAHGQPVVAREEPLTVELTGVKDSRCPSAVQCVWAGHASVTLQVTKVGSPTESLTIGTQTPRSMKLPFEATYGRYRLSLVSLEPGNSAVAPVALPLYRATVKLSRP